jgi:hypothetical protein
MAVSAPVSLPPRGSDIAGPTVKPMASTEAAIVAVDKYRTERTPRSLLQNPCGRAGILHQRSNFSVVPMLATTFS